MAMCLLGSPLVAQSVAVGSRPEGTTSHATVSVDMANAPLVDVLKAIAHQAGLRMILGEPVYQLSTRVSMHVRGVQADDAFASALAGTGLKAKISSGNVVFSGTSTGATNTSASTASLIQGIVVGKISDAKTKQPLRGAMVTVDNTSKGTTSRDDGTFRIPDVAPGSHVIRVRMLGYVKVAKTTTVVEGQTASVELSLDISVNALDQVVVTGSVIPTELKAIPNAITVITAKDIEQRGITKIDQLFRGDVPGLFAQNSGSGAPLDEVTMFSRGATALSGVSAGTTSNGLATFTNPIKTYVDGIELADSRYLSQIDPKSIERIEILTGPQASTIYGSNAINGVMQIFTKRGATSQPQLTLNLLSGWVENNFSRAHTPQHDYSAQLSGVEGRLSYNAGGSWNYMGPWTPAKQTSRTGGFGGIRLEIPTALGAVTADVTLRCSITQNRVRGAQNQTTTDYQETGWYAVSNGTGLTPPTTSTLTGQTLGVVLGYVPTSWWSHEFGIGQDASDVEQRYTARGYMSISDTTLLLSQNHTDRRSLHYTTTARAPVTSFAQATITMGADAWQNLTSFMQVSPQTLTGTLTGTTGVSRQPGHNTGGFLQAQLGMRDRLFLTYGLRAEWNPAYGEEAQPNYAPRYGIAYTQELGPITAKLRGSYGRSTRPPQPTLKVAHTAAEVASYLLPYYGSFIYSLANPELAPEHQQGGEGGLELYLGTRGSLVVTHYNQTVDGLIAQPTVDSVRSLAPSPPLRSVLGTDGYGYQYQTQYVNLGSIRNQGWELQGSSNTGPITTRGTYSWTKSRTIGVNPKYRAYFAGSPQYQPGATFQYLPEHTWALGITYARAATTVGFNVTGTGRVTDRTDDFTFRSLSSSIRLPQNRLSVTSNYINANSGYALADLTASRRFGPKVEGVLQIQNLTDHYMNDYYAGYATMGRQLKAGCRIRTP